MTIKIQALLRTESLKAIQFQVRQVQRETYIDQAFHAGDIEKRCNATLLKDVDQ
ncbi:hypothetical protein DF22_002184 [Xylella fastidiosa]|nr:hypothetical protein M233_09425 [Xylella fastidiosa subsp. multiplex Griffin-1]KFA41020.1 hypothetical protein DF22_002184 [Xylella fastidiosa]